MKIKIQLLMLLAALALTTNAAQAAAKVDPALSRQIAQASPTAQLEVVITYFRMPTTPDIAVPECTFVRSLSSAAPIEADYRAAIAAMSFSLLLL